jgi:pyruvate formate lyase activating enzyme
MELVGKAWKSDDLIGELIKDKAYFEASRGGITLSGGDPTLQAPFAELLLKKLKQMGIQTAIDTCGICSNGTLAKLLPHSDLVLFDIKEIDSPKHKTLTGQSNTRVFESLLFIRDTMAARGRPGQLWIRTPIIPGATAREDNIQGIGEYIAEHVGPVADRWELCAFNNLCQDKYQRLGLDWEFAGSELMRKSDMENLADVARNSGVDPDIVHWSGSTVIEDDTSHSKPQAIS